MSKRVNLEKLEKLAHKHRLNTKQKELIKVHIQNTSLSGYKAALKAGYTDSTAKSNPLARQAVKQTIADYIRGGNLDSKIQRHYDEALNISIDDADSLSEKLQVISTKNQVIKEVHKIAGHYAPVKRDTRSISIKLPDLDSDE